jgi:thiamine-phosphate pyrophosphorylase
MHTQNKYSHYELAKMAIKGGADMIQLRDKFLSTSEFIRIAIGIRKLCNKHKVLFVVNDRADAALVSGADGVHLGKEDIPINDAAKILGKKKIVGGTAHTLKEAVQREIEGADYIGFGHIYHTSSKHKSDKPKGIKYLKRVVEKLKIPVFAIGGIGISNINEVMSTGAHGAAVIGSVAGSKYPERVVKELRKKIYGR